MSCFVITKILVTIFWGADNYSDWVYWDTSHVLTCAYKGCEVVLTASFTRQIG